jgi:hypothetical protein
MFAIAKANGAKVKDVRSVMGLPLIDKVDSSVRDRLKDRLKKFKDATGAISDNNH